MLHAYKNLAGNKIFQDLEHTILGRHPAPGLARSRFIPPTRPPRTRPATHGTRLKVTGTETRTTLLRASCSSRRLTAGPTRERRVNLTHPGSCAACHTRHQFSIAMARKPYTCKECHVGTGRSGKQSLRGEHGNIFSTNGNLRPCPGPSEKISRPDLRGPATSVWW